MQRRQTTHANHVEQSLNRITTSLSSNSVVTENTYTTTLRIEEGVENATEILKRVDQVTQKLASDVPVMIEQGFQRCMENTLTSLHFTEFETGLQLSKDCSDRRPAYNESKNYLMKTPHFSSTQGSPVQPSHRLDSPQLPKLSSPRQQRQLIAFGRSEKELRALSGQDAKGNLSPLQKSSIPPQTRTFCRTIPFPVGFLQTKTTRILSHDSPATNSGENNTGIIQVTITLLPFRWLSSRGYTVTFDKVLHSGNAISWMPGLRCYNVVPDDSMVIQACLERDVVALQKLFQYRQASPFDVDSTGATLLGHALNWCRNPNHFSKPIDKALEVIQFLITEGADPVPFMKEFLDAYEYFSKEYTIVDALGMITHEEHTIEVLDAIGRLCLATAQRDLFDDPKILRKLWAVSLSGQTVPPLDFSYLFQEKYSGLEEIVFECPDYVFYTLMIKDTVSIMSISDKTWQRAVDQRFEVLAYLCTGGDESIKARIFAKKEWEPHQLSMPYRDRTCFCPETPSHLLFELLWDSEYFECKKSRRKLLRQHLHRMLVLLLRNGEDPLATCSCKARWKTEGTGSRTATDIAAAEGLLEVWADALEEVGYNATEIIDDWRFAEFQNVFQAHGESTVSLLDSVKFIGSTLISTVSYII